MKRHLFLLVAAATALACMPSRDVNELEAALQGTWSGCANAGGADFEERLAFAGFELRWTIATFATTDGTCGGEGTIASDLQGTFVSAELFQATLDGVPVVAQGLDFTDATHSFYTTVYVKQDALPRLLYVGEPDLTTGRDMTSGAKRPVVLSAWKPLAEEPAAP